MIQDIENALKELRTLADGPDHACVEMVTGLFDWRVRNLNQKGDASSDESERLVRNCDRFLLEASLYLESRANGKRIASVVAKHIAKFLVECETARGEITLIDVAEVFGACFAGSLFDLHEACDAIKRQKP